MNKPEILNLVKQKISNKISYLESLIEQTRASSNDTKSSMGDKYETSREMLQQEINNLQIQLSEVRDQRDSLMKIPIKNSEKVENGALVQTERGNFFISVSAGEIIFKGEKIFTISQASPLAKAMNGKSAGEVFLLNGISQKIISTG